MFTIGMASDGMIYMEIGTGIQAIIRVCLSNLRGCNVEITDWRDL
jgi:hypothetical protein